MLLHFLICQVSESVFDEPNEKPSQECEQSGYDNLKENNLYHFALRCELRATDWSYSTYFQSQIILMVEFRKFHFHRG